MPCNYTVEGSVLHHDKCISASSSVGIDLCLLGTWTFALFVSDPLDPMPVLYILTLQTNLTFGRMIMFLQYIILEFDYQSELIACYKPGLNKTLYYYPHALLIKYFLEGCTGCSSMQ